MSLAGLVVGGSIAAAFLLGVTYLWLAVAVSGQPHRCARHGWQPDGVCWVCQDEDDV